MKLFNFFKSKRESANVKTSELNNYGKQARLNYALAANTSVNDVLNFINVNKLQLGFTLNKGASDLEIEKFEKNQIHLPDELKHSINFVMDLIHMNTYSD